MIAAARIIEREGQLFLLKYVVARLLGIGSLAPILSIFLACQDCVRASSGGALSRGIYAAFSFGGAQTARRPWLLHVKLHDAAIYDAIINALLGAVPRPCGLNGFNYLVSQNLLDGFFILYDQLSVDFRASWLGATQSFLEPIKGISTSTWVIWLLVLELEEVVGALCQLDIGLQLYVEIFQFGKQLPFQVCVK